MRARGSVVWLLTRARHQETRFRPGALATAERKWGVVFPQSRMTKFIIDERVSLASVCACVSLEASNVRASRHATISAAGRGARTLTANGELINGAHKHTHTRVPPRARDTMPTRPIYYHYCGQCATLSTAVLLRALALIRSLASHTNGCRRSKWICIGKRLLLAPPRALSGASFRATAMRERHTIIINRNFTWARTSLSNAQIGRARATASRAITRRCRVNCRRLRSIYCAHLAEICRRSLALGNTSICRAAFASPRTRALILARARAIFGPEMSQVVGARSSRTLQFKVRARCAGRCRRHQGNTTTTTTI